MTKTITSINLVIAEEACANIRHVGYKRSSGHPQSINCRPKDDKIVLGTDLMSSTSLVSLLGRPKCFNFFRKMTISIDRQ